MFILFSKNEPSVKIFHHNSLPFTLIGETFQLSGSVKDQKNIVIAIIQKTDLVCASAAHELKISIINNA